MELERALGHVGLAEPRVSGDVIVTSSGYFAAANIVLPNAAGSAAGAEAVRMASGPTEIRGVSAENAIDALERCLAQCKRELQEHLLAWKTSSKGSFMYRAVRLERCFVCIGKSRFYFFPVSYTHLTLPTIYSV